MRCPNDIRCVHPSSALCSRPPRRYPASARDWSLLLKKALATAAGRHASAGSRSRLASADRIDRPPGGADRHGCRAGHHCDIRRQGAEAQAFAARQFESSLQGHDGGRYRPPRPRILPRRIISSWSGSCRRVRSRFVSGRVERYDDTLQMTHPDYIVAPENRGDLPLLEPVYALTAGLSQQGARQGHPQRRRRGARPAGMAGAGRIAMRGWPGFARGPGAAASSDRRHRRLDRALARGSGSPMTNCLPASWHWRSCGRIRKRKPARSISGDGTIRAKLRAALPFALTGSQTSRLPRSSPTWRRRAPDAAAAAGRRRLGQDGRGAHGDGDRGRGRRPDRADGADRSPGAATFGDDRAAGREGGPPRRPADGPREGQGPIERFCVRWPRARSTS